MKLPRFSLRDLFWLVLVVAMGCAWWAHYRQYGMSRYKLRWNALRLEPVSKPGLASSRLSKVLRKRLMRGACPGFEMRSSYS